MRSSNDTEAFVWVWLPDKTEPVVAGRLFADGNELLFNYGQSYLARPDALPLIFRNCHSVRVHCLCQRACACPAVSAMRRLTPGDAA